MGEKRAFLTARWTNVCLFTYEAPESVLRARLPDGLELDCRDGKAFVSLVAFDFRETRVRGVAWPGLREFPEVNLRYYVRKGGRRGVCFVSELVPSRVVSAVARGVYNEPYRRAKMTSEMTRGGGRLLVRHGFEVGGRGGRVRAECDDAPFLPGDDTTEHFFKEHEWGFGRSRSGRTLVYRVAHPRWRVFPVREWSVEVDFAGVYGAEWAFLSGARACSVVVAEGSEVAVYPAGRMA